MKTKQKEFKQRSYFRIIAPVVLTLIALVCLVFLEDKDQKMLSAIITFLLIGLALRHEVSDSNKFGLILMIGIVIGILSSAAHIFVIGYILAIIGFIIMGVIALFDGISKYEDDHALY